jgi:hypothetical protein
LWCCGADARIESMINSNKPVQILDDDDDDDDDDDVCVY